MELPSWSTISILRPCFVSWSMMCFRRFGDFRQPVAISIPAPHSRTRLAVSSEQHLKRPWTGAVKGEGKGQPLVKRKKAGKPPQLVTGGRKTAKIATKWRQLPETGYPEPFKKLRSASHA